MTLALISVLGFLITARVTRFVNDDVLAAPLRVAVIHRWGPDGKMFTLTTCPWCLSIWIAAIVAPVALLLADLDYTPAQHVFIGVALALGWSYVYGLVASNLDEG